MTRSTAAPVSTPGASGNDEGDAPDEAPVRKRTGSNPGNGTEAARIAALEAEIVALKAAAASQTKATGIVVPITKTGAAHMAQSQHMHLTSVEFMALIDAGEAKEPKTHVLCKDGWYAPRS